MNFPNSGTTYIVNASPTATFVGGQPQQIVGQSAQQQQHRIIKMPVGHPHAQIVLQQQPANIQTMLQHGGHLIEHPAIPQPQPSASTEKPLVRGKTSPYGFFVKMCYEEHKKKYPGEFVQVTEISKKCSQKWKTMSDDEKKRFFELAQKDAERYHAEVAAYGGDDALRKRKRAKKDPNAPKRALSAFFFFSNEKRPEVQQNHPTWKVGQIAKELGRFWKSTTEEERQIYEKRAVDDKERYAEAMKAYRIANGKLPPPSKTESKQEPEHEPEDGEEGEEADENPQLDQQQQTPTGQLPMQLLEEQANT